MAPFCTQHPCGPSGASGGDSLLPSMKEGSSQTTALPPEPPRASADCLSFVERSTHHFGFSKAVARQLPTPIDPCKLSSEVVGVPLMVPSS